MTTPACKIADWMASRLGDGPLPQNEAKVVSICHTLADDNFVTVELENGDIYRVTVTRDY